MKTRILFILALASYVVTVFSVGSTIADNATEHSVDDERVQLDTRGFEDNINDGIGDSYVDIEPNEVQRCLDISLFGAMELDAGADCLGLLKELTVELIASSEQGGVLTYFFHGEPVLRLSYSASSDASEMDFGGLKNLLNAV